MSEASDIDSARPPALGKVAGITLGFAGLTTLLVPAQILSSARIPPPMLYVLWAMLASGASGLIVGGALMRARGWAATTSIAVAVSLAGLSGLWASWSVTNGVLHVMPMLAAAASVLALLLVCAAAPAVLRTAAARGRLRDAGLDLGA